MVNGYYHHLKLMVYVMSNPNYKLRIRKNGDVVESGYYRKWLEFLCLSDSDQGH